MMRVLCAVALGATALLSVPAHAGQPVVVNHEVDGDTISVGVTYGDQPVGGAYVHPKSGTACAGLSYQLPLCVTVPVQIGP